MFFCLKIIWNTWKGVSISLYSFQLYQISETSSLQPVCSFHSLLLFSCSVISNSLWPHGLQHTRLPCPSPSPRLCSNAHPLSRWGHPTILSSLTLVSSCLQSFPASGSSPMSQFFASGGQSIRGSTSVLPMNIQGWFPLGLIGLISLLPKGPSRVFSNITVLRHQFVDAQPFLLLNSHILLEKTAGLHGCWKSHNFEYTDLYLQSDVSAFYSDV